jgi:multiple sugar transport system substrate-binding protein
MNVRPFFSKILIALMLVIFVGAGCGGPSQAQILASTPVTLTIWRVFDDSSTFAEITSTYRAIHPNVSFSYRELRFDEYEDELIRAFAEGNGPDIFSIHNTWVGEYASLIQPMPPSVTIPYSEVRGSIKKEVIYTVQEEPTISKRNLKTEFVDVVEKDVVRQYKPNSQAEAVERVWGLPLSVDTLALYYNKDLLNAGGIAEPPLTWTQFQEQISKLTLLGTNDTILQSGAALGSGKNVERGTDILSLLMMQNGTQMVDDRGRATFAKDIDGVFLGIDALRFYTDFANPLKQVYTWNEDQPNSFDAFTSGKTAFFFGYSYHASLIKTASPKLNFSITGAPQIDGGKTVNYANYWLETVAKSSPNTDWAWDFIEFAASTEHVQRYLKAANKPPARRALINTQSEDEDLSAFANQVLTAKSWYKGSDAKVTEEALNTLIEDTLKGEPVENSLKNAQNKVNQTL